MGAKKKNVFTTDSRIPRSTGNRSKIPLPNASKTPTSSNTPNPNPNYKPPMGSGKQSND